MYAEQLPTMGDTVFENCDADNCTLYVPKGTIDMYRQSDFSYFKNIVELDATGINNHAASTNLKEVYRYTTMADDCRLLLRASMLLNTAMAWSRKSW